MPAYGEATHEEDGEREEEEGEDDVHPQVVHLHLVLAIKTNFVYQLQIMKKTYNRNRSPNCHNFNMLSLNK